ncbi:hypothetical protein [Desulfohalobium retbaense]|uniref:Uncharacterized protein n=1 Tax=Desulfohalobium retbaense (strain ATCC 49708 / DSM 5692 / JCM 16813 / HR100) TaxID=485915 RepID=C8X4J4_DESRD|nr:hypothetical protein [Desulfohalobium retbaense]ACV69217.1 conserved hypothetical protein [Desulfohalobium retbaense DSM 5692]
MKHLPATPLRVTPFFDLETYMLLSGQRRIDAQSAQDLETLWHEAFSHLNVYQLGEKKGYLVVYLDEQFEAKADAEWTDAPHSSYQRQTVGQAVIMAAVNELLPDAGWAGCAPVPEPNKILKRSLEKIGLSFSNQGVLSAKYGILTPMPYAGGCESCFLENSCPKRQMAKQG